MKLQNDLVTKILLGFIAFGLFLNVITNVYANSIRYELKLCIDGAKIQGYVSESGNLSGDIKLPKYCL